MLPKNNSCILAYRGTFHIVENTENNDQLIGTVAFNIISDGCVEFTHETWNLSKQKKMT